MLMHDVLEISSAWVTKAGSAQLPPARGTVARIALAGAQEERVFAYDDHNGWVCQGTVSSVNAAPTLVSVPVDTLFNVVGMMRAGNVSAATIMLEGLLAQARSCGGGARDVGVADTTPPFDERAPQAADKRRRPPNKYNQYVSDTMKRLAKERPELTSKQCMAEAVMLWKASKADAV